MSLFKTGYKTIDEAVKDGFSKIGGKEEALKTLESGWYQVQYRKRMNSKNQALLEAAKKDPRFKAVMEDVKKKLQNG